MKTVLHLAKFIIGLDQPASQLSAPELLLLKQFAIAMPVVVELGCYEGRTSAVLAQQTDGRVYSVDPFLPGRLGICCGEQIARLHARRKGLVNLHFIKAFSYNAAALVPDPIDLLFIDADHSYQAVQRDWHDWVPKVRQGGFIAMHNSKPRTASEEHMGSVRFYREDVPKRRTTVVEICSVDSLVILQKRLA